MKCLSQLSLILLAAALGWAVVAISAAPRIEPIPAQLSRFAPTSDYRCVGDYAVSFDGRTRTPRWVLECLTSDKLVKNVGRDEGFRSDPEVPAEFRPLSKDYDEPVFDIGHQAAAANHESSQESLDATFLLTNAVPQYARVNRGVWLKIEKQVRELVKPDATVWIMTAPAWLPSGWSERHGKRTTATYYFVAIGDGRIWVPTHCGKAVLIEDADGKHSMLAWLVPNIDSVGTNPDAYRVTTDQFEKDVGLDVWADLPDEEENQLEAAAP